MLHEPQIGLYVLLVVYDDNPLLNQVKVINEFLVILLYLFRVAGVAQVRGKVLGKVSLDWVASRKGFPGKVNSGLINRFVNRSLI